MNLADIKPYPKNAKKHPEKQVRQIANSIKEFGFNQPIVIDKAGVIIVGHGRYEAAKLLGLTEVPTIQVDLTEERAKAYRLADNKLNESEWDLSLVIDELKGLSSEMLELTGFDKAILDVVEDNFDAQAEYDKIVAPSAVLGDLWALGRHRLMCGDSTKADDVDKLMNGEKSQMVFTDPPYNVGYDYTVQNVEGRKRKGGWVSSFKDNRSDEDFQTFIEQVFTNAHQFSNDTASFYCWHGSKTEKLFRAGLEAAGWKIALTLYRIKNIATYVRGMDYFYITEPCYFGWKHKKTHYFDKKIVSGMNNILKLEQNSFEEMLNVIYANRDAIRSYIHPTQKPIKLAERVLRKHSKQNDIVLELFNGSGSTMMACEQMNRKCYAMELDPKFCDVAIKRWELFTGQKAIKL